MYIAAKSVDCLGPEDRCRRKGVGRVSRRTHRLILPEDDDSHLADDEEDFVQTAPPSVRSMVRTIEAASSVTKNTTSVKHFSSSARKSFDTNNKLPASSLEDVAPTTMRKLTDSRRKEEQSKRPERMRIIKQENQDRTSSDSSSDKTKTSDSHEDKLLRNCSRGKLTNSVTNDAVSLENGARIKIEELPAEEEVASDHRRLQHQKVQRSDDTLEKTSKTANSITSDETVAQSCPSKHKSKVNARHRKRTEETISPKLINHDTLPSTQTCFSLVDKDKKQLNDTTKKRRKSSTTDDNCGEAGSGGGVVSEEAEEGDVSSRRATNNNRSRRNKSRITQIYACEEPTNTGGRGVRATRGSSSHATTADNGSTDLPKRQHSHSRSTSKRRKQSEADSSEDTLNNSHYQEEEHVGLLNAVKQADTVKRCTGVGSLQPRPKRSKNSSNGDFNVEDTSFTTRSKRSTSDFSGTNFRGPSSSVKKSVADGNWASTDKTGRGISNTRRSKRERHQSESFGSSSDNEDPHDKMAPPPSKKPRSSGGRSRSRSACVAEETTAATVEGEQSFPAGSDALERSLRRSVRGAATETPALAR